MSLLKCFFIAALLMLLPAPAWAWGPAAHLEFGLTVLRDLALLAPAVAALLRRFPDDFLYGSIAADITVAKNLTPYHQHCHNWQVGFSVLDLAEEDSTRAFAWGYLSHLAADVVAHNYFVPYKMVEDFQRRSAAHVYWEVRFDTLVSGEALEAARSLSSRGHKLHDAHLQQILTGTLLPFRLNKQIFNSVVLVNRFLRTRRMAAAHARRSPIPLLPAEMEEMRTLSLARIMDLLRSGPEADCLHADPTGHRNLLLARDLRRRLRALWRESRLLDPAGIGARFKPLFLEGMESKIELPSMAEITDPYAPRPQPKRRPFFKRLRRRIMRRIRKRLERPS